MNDDELKRLWQCQKIDGPAKLSPGDQIKWMRMRLRAMDRVSRLVEAMEIVVAVGCILFFTWLFLFDLKIAPLVARVGLLIMIASLVFDIWKPIRARRMLPQPTTDTPVTQSLRHELDKLRARSELKRTKLLWDLLPFWIGGIVFTWGLDIDLSAQIFSSAVFTGIAVIIYVSSWKLKQYTWRKADRLLIEELESLLQSNTPE